MIKFLASIAFVWLVSFVSVTAAAVTSDDFGKKFDIDLKAELPDYKELQEHYYKKFARYDRGYQWHWNIGNVFDNVFRMTITSYGTTEKRLKDANEERLLMMLKRLPPEYYEYIGPYLHTVPSISEKILNLPGIKETKNKFPSRIAPQLEDVEDLEFLSPYLYFLLMPEAWPGNMPPQERPQKKVAGVKQEPNKQLYNTLDSIVAIDEFLPGAKQERKLGASDLRTINITAASPLTSGDIKAFVRTLPELNKLKSDIFAVADIGAAGNLLDLWESENGGGLQINMLKDLVNPCQRLVQKMRMAGREQYLKTVVAKSGFTPEEWALTCDKTLKAYRMTKLSVGSVASIRSYVRGSYEKVMRDYNDDKMMELVMENVQAVIKMHTVPRKDILEAYKNRKLIADALQESEYTIIVAPVMITN